MQSIKRKKKAYARSTLILCVLVSKET